MWKVHETTFPLSLASPKFRPIFDTLKYWAYLRAQWTQILVWRTSVRPELVKTILEIDTQTTQTGEMMSWDAQLAPRSWLDQRKEKKMGKETMLNIIGWIIKAIVWPNQEQGNADSNYLLISLCI